MCKKFGVVCGMWNFKNLICGIVSVEKRAELGILCGTVVQKTTITMVMYYYYQYVYVTM